MPEGKTILVTGGAGYIGAHARKALAAAGYTPVTYDSLIYGHERAVKWGQSIKLRERPSGGNFMVVVFPRGAPSY